MFESGQSTSQCRDTGEGKYHSGIYKQEFIVARYMNWSLFTQHAENFCSKRSFRSCVPRHSGRKAVGWKGGQEKYVLGRTELSTVWLWGNSEFFMGLRGPCKEEGYHLFFMVLPEKKNVHGINKSTEVILREVSTWGILTSEKENIAAISAFQLKKKIKVRNSLVKWNLRKRIGFLKKLARGYLKMRCLFSNSR